MILIDTSSLVHLLRRKGDPVVKERVKAILRRGEAATCDMVEVELRMGVASAQDERDVSDLTALLIFLPIDRSVWDRAKQLAAKCRRSGRPVPAPDCVIAACAYVHQTDLDAEDSHYDLLNTFR